MRSPFEGIDAGTVVTLSNGNQFQGPGTAGNQSQSGSAVMIRKAGDPAFRPLSMQFQLTQGNDKSSITLGLATPIEISRFSTAPTVNP
jgi:hypothetical protein